MKKRQFSRLAVLGIATGLLAAQVEAAATYEGTAFSPEQMRQLLAKKQQCKGPTGCAGLVADNDKPNSLPATKDVSETSNDDQPMTEAELLSQLNDQGKRLYNSLSPEGKRLALLTADQACNHQNECAGLNDCKGDKNDCRGKGSCKGESKCAIGDKNTAVKLVVEKMAKKRQQASY